MQIYTNKLTFIISGDYLTSIISKYSGKPYSEFKEEGFIPLNEYKHDENIDEITHRKKVEEITKYFLDDFEIKFESHYIDGFKKDKILKSIVNSIINKRYKYWSLDEDGTGLYTVLVFDYASNIDYLNS